MRYAILSVALLFAACGGGSGTTAVRTAALQGLVYEVDGQTVDRSGVEIRVLETGQTVQTGPDGAFQFDGLPPGTVTLQFGTTLIGVPHSEGPENEVETEVQNETESEADELEDEDEDGNPRLGTVSGGEEIRVRCSVENGDVNELSMIRSDRRRAEARLQRDADSPDPDVEGKVKIESRLDREKFTVEAEHLAPGTVVEFFLDGTSIGTIAALADGEAELELNTNDGDRLPLGASKAEELEGLEVAVRLTTGELLLTGTVPDLPDGSPDLGGAPLDGGRGRGKARLSPLVAGLEGDVEIRRRPEDNEQEFEIEAEHLLPGTSVRFLIEDKDNPGTFVSLGTRTADSEGEAELRFRDGPLPLGVSDVEELVGLEVRVEDATTNELLLTGTVPPLVAD